MERRYSPVELQSVKPAQCTHDVLLAVLHQTPIFVPLTHDAVREISNRFRIRDYAAGEVIHHYGAPATRLEIVAAGTVKLNRPTSTGREVLLEILGPGSLFGRVDLLGDSIYTETAIANTDCCILVISGNEFREILRAYPDAAVAALEYVSTRLHSAHDVVEQLSAYPVDRRVAATLLKLAAMLGREDDEGLLIDMPLTRQDLADMTGTTVETVSRTLSKFRQEGLVSSGRRWVAITDKASLEQLAEDVIF